MGMPGKGVVSVICCGSLLVGCTWESHVAVRDSSERVNVLHAVDMLLIFANGLGIGRGNLRKEV